MSGRKVVVIGAGFAGLAASCYLARAGFEVTVVEKHDQPGGRARRWQSEGFSFDMGPSWYWMPDLFEGFFGDFGHEIHDFYDLQRLEPSYKVLMEDGTEYNLPASLSALESLFESVEQGAGDALRRFLRETKFIYETATKDYLTRPSLSFLEFVDRKLLSSLFRMKMLQSMHAYAKGFFRHPHLVRLVEWPVLFLGASAKNTSAMYSLMSYADMALGTWYPKGGMHSIVEGMVSLAESLGVEICYEAPVSSIYTEQNAAKGVWVDGVLRRADAVLGAADYHHVEQQLLPQQLRQYSPQYWDKRVMSPSSLLYYLGIRGSLERLEHHTLFFDAAMDPHMEEVYETPRWPSQPLFYACMPSKTDPAVAPPGHENLFLLIPLAAGLPDSEEERARCFHKVMKRLEDHCGVNVRDRIVLQRSYAMNDFVQDYHAFKGNAYGMANTLLQTGPLKPRLRSNKVKNLYFAGQLTVPGPGMPPSLLSGKLSSELLIRDFS